MLVRSEAPAFLRKGDGGRVGIPRSGETAGASGRSTCMGTGARGARIACASSDRPPQRVWIHRMGPGPLAREAGQTRLATGGVERSETEPVESAIACRLSPRMGAAQEWSAFVLPLQGLSGLLRWCCPGAASRFAGKEATQAALFVAGYSRGRRSAPRWSAPLLSGDAPREFLALGSCRVYTAICRSLGPE